MTRPASHTILPYRVPYADTDQMGVVYYANYLVYFERVRNEVLRTIGFPYTEMEARGFGLPVIEAHCAYAQPAHYDDLLEIHGWLGEAKGATLQACCEIWREGTRLAQGYTRHACVTIDTHRPTRLPREIIQAVQVERG